MSKPDVTFVNTMTVSGFLNGNVNLSFSTARWDIAANNNPNRGPNDPPVIVVADEYPSLFLRMDLNCAMQVRDALDTIIQQQTKPATVN